MYAHGHKRANRGAKHAHGQRVNWANMCEVRASALVRWGSRRRIHDAWGDSLSAYRESSQQTGLPGFPTSDEHSVQRSCEGGGLRFWAPHVCSLSSTTTPTLTVWIPHEHLCDRIG